MADKLLFGGSEVRREILRTFFTRPGVTHHVRELARRLGRSPTMVGEELLGLERAGILTSERIGRARRYRVDEGSPFAAEIRSLIQKTIGVEARVRQALTSVPGIEEAFLFGSYASGTERATSDLDLLVVGSVDQERLSESIGKAERDLGRDINVVTYSTAELDRLVERGDAFVRGVLDGPRVPILDRKGA